jgi:hypothetical protein
LPKELDRKNPNTFFAYLDVSKKESINIGRLVKTELIRTRWSLNKNIWPYKYPSFTTK